MILAVQRQIRLGHAEIRERTEDLPFFIAVAETRSHRNAVSGVNVDLAEGGIGARGLMHEQRSEEHTSELQSLMRISYAVFCLTKKNKQHKIINLNNTPARMNN